MTGEISLPVSGGIGGIPLAGGTGGRTERFGMSPKDAPL
jgi:hypothetical protein